MSDQLDDAEDGTEDTSPVNAEEESRPEGLARLAYTPAHFKVDANVNSTKGVKDSGTIVKIHVVWDARSTPDMIDTCVKEGIRLKYGNWFRTALGKDKNGNFHPRRALALQALKDRAIRLDMSELCGSSRVVTITEDLNTLSDSELASRMNKDTKAKLLAMLLAEVAAETK